MADSAMTVQFEGNTYELEDFTLGELAWMEQHAGCDLDQMSNFTAAVVFITAIRRRTDPNAKVEDVENIKLRDLDDDPEAAETNGAGKKGAAKKPRPTKQAKARSAPSAGS